MTSFDVKKALLLYAVTDRAWLGERTLAAVCEDVLKNGATFLQLREKELHGEALLGRGQGIEGPGRAVRRALRGGRRRGGRPGLRSRWRPRGPVGHQGPGHPAP